MGIDELISLVRTPERQIERRMVRYLVAQGLVPPPDTSLGRKLASYDEQHVKAIENYFRLKEAGFTPKVQHALREIDGRMVLPLIEGASLQVDPTVSRKIKDIHALQADLVAILLRHLKEDTDGSA